MKSGNDTVEDVNLHTKLWSFH